MVWIGGARRALGSGAWWDTAAWWAADGTRPAMIVDFNSSRIAIPRGVDAAGVAGASLADLTTLRAAAFSEAYAYTCSRSAEAALYRDSAGKLRALSTSDVPLIDWSLGRRQILPQAALTNKVTAAKHNPAGTTNVTKGGDAASTLTVVDDTAALTAAGLDTICTAGTVYRLDNSAGATAATATIGGTTGNTNAHSASVYARVTGTVTLEFSGGSASQAVSGGAYGYHKVAKAAPGSSEQVVISAAAGAVVYFILPGLYEQATAPPHPIAGTGTSSVTRAADETRFSPLVEAIIQRTEGALRVCGRLIGPETGQRRIIGQGSGVTMLTDSALSGGGGSWNGTSGIYTTAGPTPLTSSFGAVVAWSAAGRRIAVNGVAASDANAIGSRTYVALGRGQGIFPPNPDAASGWYDLVVLYPARPSNAASDALALAVAA